jgi:hypothetical protein
VLYYKYSDIAVPLKGFQMNQTLPPIPFSVQQMSQAIYTALCEDQVHEYVSGQDGEGNSIEIAWSAAHEEWHVITRTGDGIDVYYDHFCETSFADLDPEMLYDMCDNLGLIETLQEAVE